MSRPVRGRDRLRDGVGPGRARRLRGRTRARDRGLRLPERRDRRAPARTRRRRAPRARLGAPGSRGLRPDVPGGRAAAPRRDRRRSRGRRRDRDRLHLVHDAADARRRDAALPARRRSAATRTPGSSSGSTTPRSRRRTGSTRSRPSGASRGCDRYGGKISSEWFFPKALQILDEAPEVYDRGRPADRGGRLGRLAAHRRRDPQLLHGRLQGDVVEARRLPVPRSTSRRSTRASST